MSTPKTAPKGRPGYDAADLDAAGLALLIGAGEVMAGLFVAAGEEGLRIAEGMRASVACGATRKTPKQTAALEAHARRSLALERAASALRGWERRSGMD